MSELEFEELTHHGKSNEASKAKNRLHAKATRKRKRDNILLMKERLYELVNEGEVLTNSFREHQTANILLHLGAKQERRSLADVVAYTGEQVVVEEDCEDVGSHVNIVNFEEEVEKVEREEQLASSNSSHSSPLTSHEPSPCTSDSEESYLLMNLKKSPGLNIMRKNKSCYNATLNKFTASGMTRSPVRAHDMVSLTCMPSLSDLQDLNQQYSAVSKTLKQHFEPNSMNINDDGTSSSNKKSKARHDIVDILRNDVRNEAQRWKTTEVSVEAAAVANNHRNKNGISPDVVFHRERNRLHAKYTRDRQKLFCKRIEEMSSFLEERNARTRDLLCQLDEI